MNNYIKNVIVVSMFCSLFVYALTPMQRSAIQRLIKKIMQEPSFSAVNIITEIEQLHIPVQDSNDSLVKDLNNRAVFALQQQHYPLVTATTDLITGIRNHTIVAIEKEPEAQMVLEVVQENQPIPVSVPQAVLQPVVVPQQKVSKPMPSKSNIAYNHVPQRVQHYIDKKYRVDVLYALLAKTGEPSIFPTEMMLHQKAGFTGKF